jgi:LacI family transcriptional regulator
VLRNAVRWLVSSLACTWAKISSLTIGGTGTAIQSSSGRGAWLWPGPAGSSAGKVDGMLIAEGIASSEQLARLAARLPIVLIAAYLDEPHVDVIGADNSSGTKAAVGHMVEEHGKTRLFYISGPAEAPDARERRTAFEEAVAEHPGATLAGFFKGRFAAISGQLAVREILTGPRRELPDAIICGNDQMAIGAIRELQMAGIRVPTDVAVVGFDDMHLSALLAPPLTTVRQPMRLLGERACSRLLQRIADPSLPRQAERLPTELIIRESCGCGSDPHHPQARTSTACAAPQRHILAQIHDRAASDSLRIMQVPLQY